MQSNHTEKANASEAEFRVYCKGYDKGLLLGYKSGVVIRSTVKGYYWGCNRGIWFWGFKSGA